MEGCRAGGEKRRESSAGRSPLHSSQLSNCVTESLCFGNSETVKGGEECEAGKTEAASSHPETCTKKKTSTVVPVCIKVAHMCSCIHTSTRWSFHTLVLSAWKLAGSVSAAGHSGADGHLPPLTLEEF